MNKKIAFTMLLFSLFVALVLLTYSFSSKQAIARPEVSIPELKNLPELMAITAKEKNLPKSETSSTQRKHFESFREDATRVQQDLFNNDYCSFFRINPDLIDLDALEENLLQNNDLISRSPEESKSFYSLFHGEDKASSKVLSLGGPEFLRFYNALSLAGLLDGVSKQKTNLPAAELLLTQLAKENPNNGAFPYFLIKVKEELKRPQREVEQQIILAMEAKNFDTQVLGITRRLWEKGLKDLASLRVATLLIARIPLPYYIPSYNLILSYLESHPELRLPALQFGKKLMSKGIRYSQGGQEFVDWMGLEYVIGNKIYLKAWNLLYPGKELGLRYKKTLRELIEAKDEYDHQGFFDKEQVFKQILNSKDYCPRDILEKEFARLRGSFLKTNQSESN